MTVLHCNNQDFEKMIKNNLEAQEEHFAAT
jgi:hypothetical protein